MKISPEENKIIGKWVLDGKHIIADAAAERIIYLIEHHLQLIFDKGWERLYQDLDDKRYWELTYLQSELHGGGPPSLICITAIEGEAKYKI